MSQQPEDSTPAGRRATVDHAALVRAFEERCAELLEAHRQRTQRRALLASEIEEKRKELVALDVEIAGIEGHGAEAEMWLTRIRDAQEEEQPQQKLRLMQGQQAQPSGSDEDVKDRPQETETVADKDGE